MDPNPPDADGPPPLPGRRPVRRWVEPARVPGWVWAGAVAVPTGVLVLFLVAMLGQSSRDTAVTLESKRMADSEMKEVRRQANEEVAAVQKEQADRIEATLKSADDDRRRWEGETRKAEDREKATRQYAEELATQVSKLQTELRNLMRELDEQRSRAERAEARAGGRFRPGDDVVPPAAGGRTLTLQVPLGDLVPDLDMLNPVPDPSGATKVTFPFAYKPDLPPNEPAPVPMKFDKFGRPGLADVELAINGREMTVLLRNSDLDPNAGRPAARAAVVGKLKNVVFALRPPTGRPARDPKDAAGRPAYYQLTPDAR